MMLSQYNEIYDLGYDKDFLFKDRQLGQNVVINGVNAYDVFNADLISVALVEPAIEKNIYKDLGKHKYKINTFKVSNNGLEMKFYVGGHTQQEAQININRFISEFVDKVATIKFDESEFEHICVLESFLSEYTGVEFYHLVTLNVSAIKRLPMVTYDFNSTYFSSATTVQCPFENRGVVESGLDIIVRFGGSTSFEVDYKNTKGKTLELHLSSLSSSNYYYKIGGMDGVVYRAGNINFASPTNVFLNTDLTDFPVAKCGSNNITFVQGTAGNIKQVKLQFYPTFLI